MHVALEHAVNMARWNYRVAMSKGHAANCDAVWKYEACSCPGRRALHGGSIAARLDYIEEQARQEFRNAEIALANRS